MTTEPADTGFFIFRYYAAVYGVVMFYLMCALTLIGNIVLPLAAYQFY